MSKRTGDHPGVVRVDPMLPEPMVQSRYRIRGPIDEGGRGVVLQALDTNLLREAAIKQLLPAYRQHRRLNQELIEEAQVSAQLEHPNIVPVHDLGLDAEGELYFSMKQVQGETLSDLLLRQRQDQPRSARELFDQLQIFLKICDAVAFAHSRGVIHRDLKPDNVMVGAFGQVYVMDWGLALLMDREAQRVRLDEPGCADRLRIEEPEPERELVGTPEYMPPEQAAEEMDKIDARTDVFALGAILCEILTGEPPYDGTLTEVLAKAIMGQTDRCLDLAPGAVDPDGRPGLPRGVHPRLGRIAARALRRLRSERQQSVLELRDEVEGFLQGGGRFDRLSFPTGARLVRQGEEGHEAYIIVRGRCAAHKRVEGERIDLREMGPGDVFGETSVLTGEPRSATVVALEPLEVLLVTREDFDEELQSGVWPGSFLRALAARFRERDREVFRLERMARVCAHLLIHLNLAGETTSDGYRRAPWSDFCRTLAEQSCCSAEEIEAEVARSGLFVVDVEQDAIWLSEMAHAMVE
jgi:eukaryotic-like serine/threonine-protein kinase